MNKALGAVVFVLGIFFGIYTLVCISALSSLRPENKSAGALANMAGNVDPNYNQHVTITVVAGIIAVSFIIFGLINLVKSS